MHKMTYLVLPHFFYQSCKEKFNSWLNQISSWLTKIDTIDTYQTGLEMTGNGNKTGRDLNEEKGNFEGSIKSYFINLKSQLFWKEILWTLWQHLHVKRWKSHFSIETTEKYNTRQHIDILQSFCQMVIDFFHVLPTALA